MRVPPSQAGGPDMVDTLAGRVVEGPPNSRIVAYAQNGDWWVQPFRSRAFTSVGPDGEWSTAIHLGMKYAVLLVGPGYHPPARASRLPSVGGDVLAVAVADGSPGPRPVATTLRFSGYDWLVSSSEADHGGELSEYRPANAWVDERGYLHLQMGQQGSRWYGAGVRLTRSLGYGTYRFVVEDSAHMPPSAVLAMFLRDDRQDQDDRVEMDIELSRWGKTWNRNADYVVQPYYIPENTVHFDVPKGAVTYVLHWEPGLATFRAFAGSAGRQGHEVMSHVFRSGVPMPAAERVHLDLYDFHHAQGGAQHPVEVVLRKFEYLP